MIKKKFYFRVHNSKLDTPKRLEEQICKVIHRIRQRNSLASNDVLIEKGLAGDDFVFNRFTLRISVFTAN